MYARPIVPVAPLHFTPACAEDPAMADVFAMADPAPDSRIAIVSPGGLDLACALIRSGCSTASIVRLDDRIRAHEADIVIIPKAATADVLERAIPFARRMLAPMGVVVLRLASERSGLLYAWARQQLVMNGFTAIRVSTARGETLLGAALPLHGRIS